MENLTEVDDAGPEYKSDGIFSLSRTKPFPSIFPANLTPVTFDVLYTGVLSAFLLLFLSFLCIFPAFPGLKEKVQTFSRVTCAITLGLVIMACNYGQEWEVGSVHTHTAYRAGSGQGIHAQVALRLGLRSVNITLKALEEPRGDLAGETINYNERFSWAWGQGRPGFGPNAGALQQAFRAAQVRGTPLPILWVAEYFTIDGEGVRFGRHYRHAGWYAHICIWTAFPLWILTIILFKMVIRLGAQTLVLTGSMLLSAALIWALNRNYTELQIPFDGGVLTTHFGVHWYLSVVVGVLCMVIGAVVYLFDRLYPGRLSCVFGNNPLSIVEEETGEEEVSGPEPKKMNMQIAGRRVVTTVRLQGSTRQVKRVTHVDLSQDELRSSPSSQSMEMTEAKVGQAAGSSSATGRNTLAAPDSEGRESIRKRAVTFDNPMYEDFEEGIIPVTLQGESLV